VDSTDLTVNAYAKLQAAIAARESDSSSIQFRNLCVRKVEVILVRPVAGGAGSEYMARISAHAQKVVSRGGAVILQDPYERPFVNCVTMQLQNNKWKLHAIDHAMTPSALPYAE
jgi:hypothetical protein